MIITAWDASERTANPLDILFTEWKERTDYQMTGKSWFTAHKHLKEGGWKYPVTAKNM